MKRTLALFLACAMLWTMTACGGGQSKVVSAGYLPSRLENIQDGGTIPEGSEAKAEPEESSYDISSFWGEWVVKGSGDDSYDEEASLTEKTFQYTYTDTYTDSETGEATSEKETLTVECFPESFTFCPAEYTNPDNYAPWAWNFVNSSWNDGYSLANDVGLTTDESETTSEEDPSAEGVPLAETLEDMGYGIGNMTLKRNLDDNDDPFADLNGNTFSSIYTVSGNTLAMGLLEISEPSLTVSNGGVSSWLPDESINESDVFEIDYEISWSGSELTLTYDGESVVYVPADEESGYGISLEEAGPVDEASQVEDILGITCDSAEGTAKVMRDTHEGYVDSTLDAGELFSIDGTEYSYVLSEHSLTLYLADGTPCVYSGYTTASESYNMEIGYSFYVGDEEIQKWEKISDLTEQGFQTDASMSQMIPSCAVTDDLVVEYNGAEITIKAANPYENAVPLSDCYVCSVMLDDADCVVRKGDSIVGETTYEEIEYLYEAAYEKKPNLLRYRTSRPSSGVIKIGNTLTAMTEEERAKVKARGDVILDPGTECEVLYDFENGVLKDVRIERPTLLYNDLQDNVDYDQLQNMGADAVTGVAETRDDVLTQLKQAFEDAGVSVDIDESSGEIVMDSSVLFDYDSSELSAAGQDYIDSFMGVYASVILDDSMKDIISEVRFEGHTDSNGSYDYNLDLSQKRADAVLDYCLSSSEGELDSAQKSRLEDIASAIGYSYSDLVYDDDGNEDADASRRVAIKFYINVDGTSTSGASETSQTAQTTDEETDTSETTSTGELTDEDFQVTYDGKTEDAKAVMEEQDGNVWYFFDTDGDDSDFSTARGVQIGGSLSDVYNAYGNTAAYEFSEDTCPFYDAEDENLDQMKNECAFYCLYWEEDADAIAFFFDEDGLVIYVVYYIDT